MSGSLIGALRVTLGIDTAAFEQGLGIAQKKLGVAGKSMQAFGDRMTGIGKGLSIAATAPLVAFGVTAVQAANESAAAIGQVEAALNSMGPVAGKTSAQLQKAAEDLQHLSTFDDDDILKSVTANMLTFGNIAGETFDRAQLAALNLSARLGQDLQSSAIQVGKALNDPVKGVAALSRVGVSFTAQQKAQIKAMAEAGEVAGAQAIILGELEKQFGGAAKAARDATPGADTLDAWRNFQETVGAIVVEVLPPLMNMLTGVLNAFNDLDPGTQSFVAGLAAVVAVAGPVLLVFGTLASGIGGLVTVFGAMGPVFSVASAAIGLVSKALLGLLANPIVLTAAAVIGGIYLAWKNWDKIEPIIDAVGKAITDWWTGNVKPVFDLVMEKVRAVGQFFSDIFGAQIKAAVGIVSALLKGDFAGAWDAARQFVSTAINAALNALNTLAPGAVAAIAKLTASFVTWLGDLAGRMIDLGKNIIQGLVRGIMAAPQAVWNALKSVVLRGVENIREFLGINSPSLLFMEMGGFITEGLAIGIENGTPTVRKAMAALSDDITAGFTGAPIGMEIDPATEGAEERAGAMKEAFRRTFSDGVKAALSGDLKGFFSNWFEGLTSRAFENVLNSLSGQFSNLLGGLFGSPGGGGSDLGGLFGSVLSSLFGGRASGGPVMANTPYIVGERRAELFVPSTAGRIEPNLNGMGRGGTTIINNWNGVQTVEDFWNQINRGHASAAQRGAAGGAQLAMQQLQRNRQRALA